MSDGATGDAVPGAATGEELAAMWAEYERALPWIAAPWDEYFPALFATLDALTGALARAVERYPAEAPWHEADGLLVGRACFYCGRTARGALPLDHADDCPVRILARARGGRDGGE